MSGQGIVGEYLSLKEGTDADLLAMQCGDFYEFFAEDAETVSDELDLKVSQKSSHGSSYPMAGVPVSELTPYLKALVERGYRVAVADQYETDDGHAREVTRVVTPGTLLETDDDDAQYLAAVVAGEGEGEGEGYGLAFADVTTGQFLATAVEDADAVEAELYRYDPVELLPGPAVRTDDALSTRLDEATDAEVTLHDTEAFAPGRTRHAVTEQFGREAVDSVGLDSELAVRAAGAVLGYVADTGVGVAESMTRLRAYRPSDHLDLDATTQRNLELVETMRGERSGSLFHTVDHTVTSPGGRLLREWLTRPRRDRAELERRLDAVDALATAALARDRVREALDGAADLERLAARATSGSADAAALLRVRETLAVPADLEAAIDGTDVADSPVADVVAAPDREAAADLRAELEAALAEDPPGTLTEGGLIRRGYDEELDELVARHEEVREWLDGLAEREKRRHGLAHVTVDRNKTDGYYIQVGKSVADEVPEHYREIKTLKNSKRFVTDELERKEREVLRLEEARGDLEYDLFVDLRERVAARAALLQDVGRAVAEVDALASLAEHAAANGWTRPELADPGPLHIEGGRHPVVEATTDFVPTDLRMDNTGPETERNAGDGAGEAEDPGFLIVTGPNMSGKSTYMRQAALVTLLAQAGSFVPADRAVVGLVDGIYTRVGALDELAGGRSTFMVEMQELSNILHSATDDSLVVLDEVGRGTATYDGVSIAWAATEYLSPARATSPSPKVLFATHYHELTTLADHVDGVENVHMAVAGDPDEDDEVTFLRTVAEGPADRSYGVHVAELAGVPDPVVSRAREVLRSLREDRAIDVRGGKSGTEQVVFDLDSGEFRARPSADGGRGGESAPTDGGRGGESVPTDGGQSRTPGEEHAGADSGEGTDPEVEEVLSELRGTDVNETPPVELMAKVKQWQERLEE